MRRVFSFTTIAAVVFGCMTAQQAAAQVQGQVSIQGDLAIYTNPNPGVTPQIDFANAVSMDMPTSQYTDDMRASLLADQPSGTPGYARGGAGNGQLTPMFLGAPNAVGNQEFGNAPGGFSEHPFSTARADLKLGSSQFATNNLWPYRAAGKLFFQIGSGNYLCSASLIKRGVIVTAAHCVANYGASSFYHNWVFVPGYRNGAAPFGVWTGSNAIIMAGYYNGSTACSPIAPGVICPHDVAVIELASQGGSYPGTNTGWFGYGWDGYGFTPANLVHITQLGYPVCLDNGYFMQRNDSHGFIGSATNYQSNTIIGSLMCGGSSGGPWLTTFGIRPSLTATTAGNEADPNIVVGVTSWGYTSTSFKQQGATRFRSSNIVVLVNAACGNPVTDARCM